MRGETGSSIFSTMAISFSVQGSDCPNWPQQATVFWLLIDGLILSTLQASLVLTTLQAFVASILQVDQFF